MGERGNEGPSNAPDPRPIGGNDSAEQQAESVPTEFRDEEYVPAELQDEEYVPTDHQEESTSTDEGDRLAALEARIEQLEAANDGQTDDEGEKRADDPPREDRVDALAAEVAALRETTERLESTLADAVDELDAIRESEYGAIDEKRERQFETAVKSMVAFHQLATDVLDVRVENYEPAAGHADAERVEATRDRIAEALGVGEGVDTGDRIRMDDEPDWPEPEEAARGGRVVGGEGGGLDPEARVDAAGPTPESDAPDTGVYPPIGGDDGTNSEPDAEPSDEADPAEAGTLPQSLRPADGGDGGDPWRLTGVDPESAREVRDAIQSSEPGAGSADPYPEGEAYARIVDERPDEQPDRSSPGASVVDERYPSTDDD